MIRIIGNGSTGKTKRLLEECSRNGGILVCKNPSAMETKCKSYGITNVKNCITYLQFLEEVNEFTTDKYYVDELENLFNEKVAGYTLTNGEN